MPPRVTQYVEQEAATAGTKPFIIMSRDRTPKVAHARWRVMRRLRDDGFTLAQIGQWLNRDHTAVIYGLRNLQCTK